MPGPGGRTAATRAAYYGRTSGGGTTVQPAGPQSGDPRCTNTGFGFAELQVYRNGRWISTGETADIDSGGGAGRTQFPSERALDVAQARRLEEQSVIDKARLEAERIGALRSEMNDLRQARITERTRAREGGVEMAGVDPFRTLGSLREI